MASVTSDTFWRMKVEPSTALTSFTSAGSVAFSPSSTL